MLFIIIALLVIGFVLLGIELLFIPGTTLVGLLGLGFSIAAIVVTFGHYGNETGWYVFIGTSALKLVFLVYSLRAGFWTKFSLKTAITSKVNEGLTETIQLHEQGTTVSTLRPVGKARFNKQEIEVRSPGIYVPAGVNIRVVQIESNQIIVEPTN